MIERDKFARVAALRPARPRAATVPRIEEADPHCDRLSQLLGAQIRRNHFGEHLSLRQWYSTPEMCEADARSLSLLLPADSDAAALLPCAADPTKWLFLDTETTGLAGGTGTYPFLVGIAWWDSGGLQVEQLFMRDLDEEHSLLLELAQRMEERPVLVTFNGKSFDWPLLETRYRMTRSIPCRAPKVHLDFLHPARQIWRPRLGSVRLRELEQTILCSESHGLDWSRHDDINSSLIPQMYFDYLRGGVAEPLTGIFRHNQMDLRGLAAIAVKILALLDSGNGIENAAHRSAHDAIDVVGLSRILRRRGQPARARELYESALSSGLPGSLERLAQRELAQLAKKEADYPRATALWEELRRASTGKKCRKTVQFETNDAAAVELAIEAAEQLAIYCEHRAGQPRRAAEFIRAAMAELREAQSAAAIPASRAARIEGRLARRFARLQRRCEAAASSPTLISVPSSP